MLPGAPCVEVRVLRDMKAGDEAFLDYGKTFWAKRANAAWMTATLRAAEAERRRREDAGEM